MIYILETQYELLRQSRISLLEYCSTISSDNFLLENPNFGKGSIRNLFVHTANAYEHWIGKALKWQEIKYTSMETITDFKDVYTLYEKVDDLMKAFFEFVTISQSEYFEMNLNGAQKRISVLELFTHMLTHEFHHKGQILSMSRSLGYTPADTDIL